MSNDLPSTTAETSNINKTHNVDTVQNSSVISILCRICYDADKEDDLISPCNCRGTVAFVHRTCLETWLGESNTTECELCHQVFKTERSPRYTSAVSIWFWLKSSRRNSPHGARTDILACTIITPLAIVITYVCLFSSEYYNQQRFANVPAARWTSVSMLIMVGIILTGYYLWAYSVIRMHARIWYSWWQRTCNVRYIPPSTIELSNSVSHEANVLSQAPDVTVQSGSENEVVDTQLKYEMKVTSSSETSTVCNIENSETSCMPKSCNNNDNIV